MSAQIKDGGPAFPVVDHAHATQQEVGMTLRDYFAATVGTSDLAGIRDAKDRESLAGRPHPESYPCGLDSIKFNLQVEAALRMMYADAMLRAREVHS